jgi:hypothetical protein
MDRRWTARPDQCCTLPTYPGCCLDPHTYTHFIHAVIPEIQPDRQSLVLVSLRRPSGGRLRRAARCAQGGRSTTLLHCPCMKEASFYLFYSAKAVTKMEYPELDIPWIEFAGLLPCPLYDVPFVLVQMLPNFPLAAQMIRMRPNAMVRPVWQRRSSCVQGNTPSSCVPRGPVVNAVQRCG